MLWRVQADENRHQHPVGHDQHASTVRAPSVDCDGLQNDERLDVPLTAHGYLPVLLLIQGTLRPARQREFLRWR